MSAKTLNPDCICDDLCWDEYCCEACDGPYEEFKARIEKERKEVKTNRS